MDLTEKVPRFKFQHPGNIVLYGKSYSGKTTFLKNLLENAKNLFITEDGTEIQKIVYCYGSVWQDKFDKLKEIGVIFIKGLPSDINSVFKENETPGIIIFDDLQREIEKSTLIQDLVSRDAHHRNLSCIIVYQGIHPVGKHVVAIRNQFHTMIYFKFTNEDHALRRRFRNYTYRPKAIDTLMDTYYKWTKRIGGYMIIDQHPRQTFTQFSIRTNVLPGEGIARALRPRHMV